jgi:5-methylcytosine-specific restriction endonuclease McrA
MGDFFVWAIPKTGDDKRDNWRIYELTGMWMRYPGDDLHVGYVLTGGQTEDEFHAADVTLRECESLWHESALLTEKWREEDTPNTRDSLRAMPYKDYLLTKEWRIIRTRKLESVGYACQVCNRSGVQLDVHHRTYERRGAELDTDLTVLCHACHNLFHKAGRI